MTATEDTARQVEVSVIVPARNEEMNLGACLASLMSQAGVASEVIVVDDHSTDRTPQIAHEFAGVNLIEAGPLPAGWTGKNNAVTAGARAARGAWLLFTDADTIHLPGSLARALAEARKHSVDLLSYSPEQLAVTFWELAVLPVVFRELARQYPPSEVSDPASPVAAANGQYILITREAYDAVGGHAADAGNLLEDVALARAVKSSGRKIRFRYGGDAVRTRMYRSFAALRDGWTKNLALLFPHPVRLAAWAFAEFGIALVLIAGAMSFVNGVARLPRALWFSLATAGLFFLWLRSLQRTRAAHFPTKASAAAMLGLPVFGYLLLRSVILHKLGGVSWKDRKYSSRNRESSAAPGKHPATAIGS